MKILLSLLLLLYLPFSVLGQNVVLANDKMNVAYAGIPNPITIAVENYKAAQVIVSTDNGTLVSKGNGHYDYTPLNAGKAIIKIEVKTKNGSKGIGQMIYRIKLLPTPVASFSRNNYRSYIDYKSGIVAQIPFFDFDVHFEIVDYQVLIISNNKTTFTAQNEGAAYQDYILQHIGLMKTKDRLIIDNIHCIGPDKRIRTLNPIVLTL